MKKKQKQSFTPKYAIGDKVYFNDREYYFNVGIIINIKININTEEVFVVYTVAYCEDDITEMILREEELFSSVGDLLKHIATKIKEQENDLYSESSKGMIKEKCDITY